MIGGAQLGERVRPFPQIFRPARMRRAFVLANR